MNRKSAEKLARLDTDHQKKEELLASCRLKPGQVWEDPVKGHRVGVLDACSREDMDLLMNGQKARLVINDPPYNVIVGRKNTANLAKMSLDEYMEFSAGWVTNAVAVMEEHAHLYIWLGADQTDGFQPLPDFMIMMRSFEQLSSRSFITMRNQRGYGTQKNWMSVRQELLYYTKGKPDFKVVYTDIPKILRQGYYKNHKGKNTCNMERSKSDTIRPGNVWVDIQQVFYRLHENVAGAYAQKPLSSVDRIVETSSKEGETVADFFAHSGSTLISCEKQGRVCCTCDIDPVFAELTIRRLENYRETGEPGWQWNNPFEENI